MIAVTVNGKPRQLDGPMAVPALLESLDISAKRVAVAVNGEVVPRSDWPRTTVSEGDAVEVVRAVGGGARAPATTKETLLMDALLLLLVFAAGFAAAVQILVNGDMGAQRGVTEALLVSVTVTFGCAVLVMLARYLFVGELHLDTPGAPLLYLLPVAIVAVLAFLGLMRGLEWYYFLGGAAGALIVFTVAYAGPRIGIAATSATLIAGQMAGAIVFDQMALLSQAKDPIDAFKILGAALVVAGVFLVRGL
jgi:thiamine biosynthesis protein ThiS